MGENIMAKPLKKISRASRADIVVFASNLLVALRRDIAEFALKGISSADFDALEAKKNELLKLPSDVYYSADVSIIAKEKNDLRAELVIDTRVIVSLAKIKWGVGSAQYERFAAGKMTTEKDAEFLTSCRRVHETATVYFSVLSTIGLTQEMLDSLAAKTAAFEQKLMDIAAAKEQRILKTEERTELTNELYSLASYYCTVGKIIWQDRNYALYNEYLVYKLTGLKQYKSIKK